MTTCSTSHKLVDWEAAARWVKELQSAGHKVVFTNGCFDLLHAGHVATWRRPGPWGTPSSSGSTPMPR